MAEVQDDLRGFKWRIDAMEPHLTDWISQNDFDHAAANEFGVGPMCDGRSSSGIILDPNSPWLSLLQILVSRDIVEQKAESDVFFYRMAVKSRV